MKSVPQRKPNKAMSGEELLLKAFKGVNSNVVKDQGKQGNYRVLEQLAKTVKNKTARQ